MTVRWYGSLIIMSLDFKWNRSHVFFFVWTFERVFKKARRQRLDFPVTLGWARIYIMTATVIIILTVRYPRYSRRCKEKNVFLSSPSICLTTWVSALHLHSTWSKKRGHPQSSVQKADWSGGVDLNKTFRPPSPRSWNVQRGLKKCIQSEVLPAGGLPNGVPDQRHLGRDRMAAAFRPGQSLTRTKKQACSTPLLLSLC